VIEDPVAQALHHKSTLGGTLTPEEQERLQQWYAKWDEEEAAMFARARERQRQILDDLDTKIAEASARIIAETAKVQALEKENERLRDEIEVMKRQIAEKMVPQTT
jgi:serine phosphatase RsbU (regulator of sigma subunit)